MVITTQFESTASTKRGCLRWLTDNWQKIKIYQLDAFKYIFGCKPTAHYLTRAATLISVHPNNTPPGMGAIAVTQLYRENLLNSVKESIQNDIPVTLLYLFNNSKYYNYDKYLLEPVGDKKWNHYINVTEVIEDKIMDKTILTISTWGCKYQIIWGNFVYSDQYLGYGNEVILYD